jgi:hypothetical protein
VVLEVFKLLAIILGIVGCGMMISGVITVSRGSTGTGGSYYDPRSEPELTGDAAASAARQELAIGSVLLVIASVIYWYEHRNEG